MKYDSLSLERLKEMLDYNPDTGVFVWKQRPHKKSRSRAGDVAGALKHTGSGSYRYIGIDSRSYLASQLAFFYVHGRWARGQVGVKNEDPSDLRADNLLEMRTTADKHDLNTREGRARYQKDYWANNSEYRRELGFKRYYGITFDDFQRMYNEQNGVCAICHKPETVVVEGKVKWLSVDHCHDTKAVRGLLCHSCNHGLGHFFDNPEALRAAADYIEHHRALSDNVIPLKAKASPDG